MSDQHVEVSERGFLSRLRGAIGGVVFGLILTVVSVVLLFSNEGRAVGRHKALVEGRGAVVSASADSVDSRLEGELVHVAGVVSTDEVLTDPRFGVETQAIELHRKVEMYQWQESSRSETKNKVGGGTRTETTYSYEPGWSDRAIDSSSFSVPAGHDNPPMPFSSQTFLASTVHLGVYLLGDELTSKIPGVEPLVVRGTPDDLGRPVHAIDYGWFLGTDPQRPEIGDLRVTFSELPPTEISVVARQSGDRLGSYTTTGGGTIALVSAGNRPADAMFDSAVSGNRTLTWILRVAGFVVMALGLRLILGPLAVLADVIPPLGRLVGAGVGVISLLLAAAGSLAIITVAWIFYRPLLGAFLLLITLVAVVMVWRRLRAAKSVQLPPVPTPAPAVPPPPPS